MKYTLCKPCYLGINPKLIMVDTKAILGCGPSCAIYGRKVGIPQENFVNTF